MALAIEPCFHCGTELDGGDIYTILKNDIGYKDKTNEDIIKIAQAFGWTEQNPKRFSNKVIVQPINGGTCFVKCPHCDIKLSSQ